MTETTKAPVERRTTKKRQLPTTAPAGTSPDGLRAQGVRTRNAIVRVARKLLLEVGPMDFSLRAVAVRAGISISNLQYYFPSRPAVLRAVMEPEINVYLEDLRRVVDSNAPPHEVFDAMLQQTLHDAKDVKYVALWRHFLSFASTDPECAKLFDEWYATLTNELATVIRGMNPKVDVTESMHVASLVISLADGLALQLGTGRMKRTNMKDFEERYAATAHAIVQLGMPRTHAR
ncbi:TetR/AcrR family transcriptional regulator [Cupriavidus sp. PET2-C1]